MRIISLPTAPAQGVKVLSAEPMAMLCDVAKESEDCSSADLITEIILDYPGGSNVQGSLNWKEEALEEV